MIPDFPKKTVDTLAKRASFLCSNPACRKGTIGPNAVQDKATTIGEAAHIKGAREKAPRYDSEMTDAARGEITNGIWLCRNCHKLIDSDPLEFPTELLFAWREEHEAYVGENLGSASDRIRLAIHNEVLTQFEGYPAIVRRLAADKPDFWEYRITAELLRYLNKQHFRQLSDLSDGLYKLPKEQVFDEQAFS